MSELTEGQKLVAKYRQLFKELEALNVKREIVRAEMLLVLNQMAISERALFFATYPEATNKDFLKALHDACTDFT